MVNHGKPLRRSSPSEQSAFERPWPSRTTPASRTVEWSSPQGALREGSLIDARSQCEADGPGLWLYCVGAKQFEELMSVLGVSTTAGAWR